ncbi:MAG: tellurium resistance protein TerC [Chloroflexi bacterium RBG_16_56_11]|nr:MAG: tellurium resistance protein TerC [Chloroflexi bacterium RBG_16_56_11]
MSGESILWIVFGILVPLILVLDLGVFHRKSHKIKVKEALLWSALWISIALLFAVAILFMVGRDKALEFVAAYLVEESLSVDNLFVFLLIFSYFCVPDKYQHRVLFWGILGAVVMRGIFIVTGLTLLEKLHWIIYVFGAFLVYTGVRISLKKDGEVQPEKNPVLRLFRRFVPMTKKYHANCFTIKKIGKRVATPLLLVLVVIETTDIVFAVDSVPAVLAISRDPFIVYTSNIFAIMGLRSIFFALAGVIQRLCYLNYGLSAILVFLGLKMLGSEFVEVPVGISLGVVGGILVIAAIVSLLWPKKSAAEEGTGRSENG